MIFLLHTIFEQFVYLAQPCVLSCCQQVNGIDYETGCACSGLFLDIVTIQEPVIPPVHPLTFSERGA